MTPPTMGRICREVQSQLPAYVAGTLPRWRRRLVSLHLQRCSACRAELENQREVAEGLQRLGAALAARNEEPPPYLLNTLLSTAEHQGVRGRAAVPVRGAVSGARPALSVALLIVGAAAGTAAGYAGWRSARAVRERLPRLR